MNEQSRIVAAPADARERVGARFSAREFERMIDAGAFDDMKVELIGGELDRIPPPQTQHSSWQGKLFLRLGRLIEEARLFVEIGIGLNDETIVGADIAVTRTPIAGNRWLDPAEIALIVEVSVSSLGRDLGLKRGLYAVAEIGSYWVVDPERGVTHVYREPVAGEYRTVSTVPFDQPLPVPGSEGTITLG